MFLIVLLCFMVG